MLICKYGYYDKKKFLKCRLDDMVCLHIKYCQLTTKWSQTDAAAGCLKREVLDDGKTGQEPSDRV